MDEKRTGSSPSTDTDEKCSETTTPEDTLDAPAPGESPDGGWSFVTQAHYDPTDPRDLTTVIVGAIAEAEDVPVVEIKDPPLYDVVDVAGLDDALFGRPDANLEGTDSCVQFRYDGYKVGVAADGWVTVYDRPGASAADAE